MLVGQWSVPVPLVLDGADPSDRQLLGLGDPVSGDAAASVDAVRAGAMSYAAATGTDVLSAQLVPAPDAYITGMTVTLVPMSTNNANVQVDLNGLGPRDLIKTGDLPLDSADLPTGMPARMIYDGSRFRLLSSATLPCHSGFSIGSREYCIEDSSHAAITFYDAVVTCTGRGARLCSYSEWVYACLKQPGFIGTVLDYEWVDDAANHTDAAKLVGNGGTGSVGGPMGIDCKHGALSQPIGSYRYRCCTHR